MNLENLTTKSREVVTAAASAATTMGNSSVEPAHLLAALLVTQGSTAPGLLRAVGADPASREVQDRDDPGADAAGHRQHRRPAGVLPRSRQHPHRRRADHAVRR